MIKIIVDCFGGDRSPMVNVEGAVLAVNDNQDIELILAGDEIKIQEELNKYTYDKNRISILHAPDVISCNDTPTIAIRQMKESSLVKSLELLHTDESVKALVSIGSTGAVLAGAVMKVGRIKGVKRPAFCPICPTMNRSIVGVCDSGANVDCEPYYLQQFALMGNLYMQKCYNIEKPRVALLNIGTEEEKGDQLRKETYQLLKQTPSINFVGNMESRDLLSGNYDLVVCDGFSGNVLIKSTEGTALELLKLLKQSFMSSFKNKLGALLLKKSVMEIKDYMDYNNYGGGVMLGVKKIIIKGHGSSKTKAIYNCIQQAYTLEKNKICQAIEEEISKMDELK